MTGDRWHINANIRTQWEIQFLQYMGFSLHQPLGWFSLLVGISVCCAIKFKIVNVLLLPFTKVKSGSYQLQKDSLGKNYERTSVSEFAILAQIRSNFSVRKKVDFWAFVKQIPTLPYCPTVSYCAYWGRKQDEGLWLWLFALVTCDSWQVTRDTWHLTRHTWLIKKIGEAFWIFLDFLYQCFYPHTSRDSVSPYAWFWVSWWLRLIISITGSVS